MSVPGVTWEGRPWRFRSKYRGRQCLTGHRDAQEAIQKFLDLMEAHGCQSGWARSTKAGPLDAMGWRPWPESQRPLRQARTPQEGLRETDKAGLPPGY